MKNKKSLNIPNVHINLPSLTPKDISFVHFCAKNNVEYIIHSFVRNVQDIEDIKNILKEYPEYKGELAKVLVSEDPRVYGKGGLLDQFTNNDMPRIALSVDMLFLTRIQDIPDGVA